MRSALGLGLVLVLAGCSSGGGGDPAPAAAVATPATQQPPAATPTGPTVYRRWWSGDLHVHTQHSGDGFDTVAQTLAMARYQGMDFCVLSDHDTLTQRQDPAATSASGVEPVFGLEWTKVAHGGVIGARTVPPDLGPSPGAWLSETQAVIDAAHAEGAAFILYHPMWHMFPWVLPVRGADAVEVWNSFWTSSDIGLHPSTPSTIAARMRDKGLTAAGATVPPEIARAATRPGGANDQALYFWEELLERGDRVAAVGGSDRHRYFLPGYPSTWVLSTGSSEAEVVAAIREGRTMVTDSPRGPRVTLEADADNDGGFEAAIGDVVPAGTITLRLRVDAAGDATVRILKRRSIVFETRAAGDPFETTIALAVQPGDWIRVDVLKPVDWSFRTQIPIYPPVVTNQVVVDCAENYLRILNADITGATFNLARAAITSPIYVR